jgi:sodium-dependent dicarboxylate transporter 2/3/5
MSKNLKLLIAASIPGTLLLIPTAWIPIQNLTLVEHRLIAIFFMAALFWILEPIPIFATSVLIIVLELVLVSDKGFILFRQGDPAALGTLLNYQEILGTFASPIIMLFLGGFFLAMAATKYQLDLNLARVLLTPFGQRPANVLLGLMCVTAIFSMFMSNTATTAMMLAILTPVLNFFPKSDRGRAAFVLGIPVAANIGGIGTPIGTPPNAIALKYLTGANAIGFGTWMTFAVPYMILLLLGAWGILLVFHSPQSDTIQIKIEGKFRRNWKAVTVYITFLLTIFLWLTDFLHGMNSYIVAMLPVGIFSATGIISREDLKQMSWDVLWLLAGGIALGVGLEKSGLALHLIQSIPFTQFSPFFIVLLATLMTFLMANFMSHTATANLLLPIMAALSASLPALAPLGGSRMLILSVTFTASIAMSLPISTPPNALAHASGEVSSRDMFRSGILIGLMGLGGIYLLMFILKLVGFFG